MDIHNSGLVILILVQFLDSPSFTTRQAAELSLSNLGTLSLPQLILVDKDPSSIEASVRIKRLLKTHNSTIISIMLDGKPPPYIDSLPFDGIPDICPGHLRNYVFYDYVNIARSEGFEEMVKKEGKMLPSGEKENWPVYRLAGRLWLEDLRSNGIKDEELRRVIKLLNDRCEYYLKNKYIWPLDD